MVGFSKIEFHTSSLGRPFNLFLMGSSVKSCGTPQPFPLFGENIPNPDSFLITRWGLEPYILGSYSAPGHNQDDLKLRTELANPIENKIFFAGEATSVNEYGFTHSALNTGLREAKKIKELYPLDL